MKIEFLKKKVAFRWLSVFLLIAILLPTFVACKGDGGETETEAPVTLNGTPLSDYEIIFSWNNKKGEMAAANQLKSTLAEKFGVELRVMEDSEELPQKAIVIGDADAGAITSKTLELADAEYCIEVDADKVYVLARSSVGFEKAMEMLYEQINAGVESQSITVTAREKQSYASNVLNTMTFNIYHWDKADLHVQRVQTVLKENKPDVIGFQEITQQWIGWLMEDSEISSLYGYVGKARGDYTEEWAAIFYRKDMFNLIESKTRWLYGEDGSFGSNTVGGLINSMDEYTGDRGKIYYRIYTYAILERKVDSKQIVFINTHLDVGGQTSAQYPGERDVPNKQIEYIINFAKAMQAQGYPVVLTGDFNGNRSSVICKKIFDAGFISTETASANIVYNANAERPYNSEKSIDHIFVLAENCYFDTYTCLNNKIRRDYPSDHHARLAKFILE